MFYACVFPIAETHVNQGEFPGTSVTILIASDMLCAGMKDAFKADLLPEICRKDVLE